jgi:hypothetical protein
MQVSFVFFCFEHAKGPDRNLSAQARISPCSLQNHHYTVSFSTVVLAAVLGTAGEPPPAPDGGKFFSEIPRSFAASRGTAA